MESQNIIEVNGLTFKRGERLIFDNISLSIPRGKITAIMGPSGTGKTTLLRLIGAQLFPQSGRVLFEGDNLYDLSRQALFKARQSMGVLFQTAALFTDLTVFENVAFPLKEHTNLSRDMIRDLVNMKLEMVGLRGAANLMPSALSGGMARRAALARAIALDPALMMYDEPFTGQDPISMGVLVRLLRTINDALDLTSIIVSHDVEETMSIADYVYVISGGQVLGEGSPEALRQHTSPWVQQFIRGEPDGPVPFHYPAEPLEKAFLEKPI